VNIGEVLMQAKPLIRLKIHLPTVAGRSDLGR
jgi:hypothetical protein